jgi:hypothetical protein
MPLASTEDNVATARAAGFDDVRAELVDLPQRFDDFGEYWDVPREVAGPLALIVRSLAPDEIAAVRSTVEEFAASFRAADGSLTFPSRRILVHAR